MSESEGIDSLFGGTMPKAYSGDMRTRVIARVESGASRREAADYYDISPSTAVIWVKCFRETGRCAAKPRGGSISPLEEHAEFLLALISMLMSFAMTRKLRSDNPAAGIKKPPIRKMERFLSEEEIARLARALDAEFVASGNPYPPAAIKLLLLTGARRGEIAGLQWQNVDFKQKCLRLPDSKTGAKVIYLNEPALAIIRALPRLLNNLYVIPGNRIGAPSGAIDRVWARVRSAAELRDVRLHDLRHSFASIGVVDGLSLSIIGALLGHKQSATTSRYAHLAPGPLRIANDAIGSRIATAMQVGLAAPRSEASPKRAKTW